MKSTQCMAAIILCDLLLFFGASHAGRSALLCASKKGSTKKVWALLKLKVNPNYREKCYGKTPLLEAVCGGHENVVALLLAAGANPNRADYRRRTPLLEAVIRGYDVIVLRLLEKGALPDETGYKNFTPLRIAAVLGHERILSYLLRAGANPESAFYQGDTLLYQAARSGFSRVVAQLLVAGENPNAPGWWGNTPLHGAITGRHEDIVRQLLNAGASPEQRGEFLRDTPLYRAVVWGNALVVEELLRRNVKTEAAVMGEDTPLRKAVEKGCVEIVRQLLHAGADPNRAGYSQITPLAEAVDSDYPEIMTCLLYAGGNPNQRCLPNDTLLSLAAVSRSGKIIEQLFKRGVRVTSQIKELDAKSIALIRVYGSDSIGRARVIEACLHGQARLHGYGSFPNDLRGLLQHFIDSPISVQAAAQDLAYLQ